MIYFFIFLFLGTKEIYGKSEISIHYQHDEKQLEIEGDPLALGAFQDGDTFWIVISNPHGLDVTTQDAGSPLRFYQGDSYILCGLDRPRESPHFYVSSNRWKVHWRGASGTLPSYPMTSLSSHHVIFPNVRAGPAVRVTMPDSLESFYIIPSFEAKVVKAGYQNQIFETCSALVGGRFRSRVPLNFKNTDSGLSVSAFAKNTFLKAKDPHIIPSFPSKESKVETPLSFQNKILKNLSASLADPKKKRFYRLTLAQFYNQLEFYEEARGVLELAYRDDPDLQHHSFFIVNYSLASFMTHKLQDGQKFLTDGRQGEVKMWQELYKIAQGETAPTQKLINTLKQHDVKDAVLLQTCVFLNAQQKPYTDLLRRVQETNLSPEKYETYLLLKVLSQDDPFEKRWIWKKLLYINKAKYQGLYQSRDVFSDQGKDFDLDTLQERLNDSLMFREPTLEKNLRQKLSQIFYRKKFYDECLRLDRYIYHHFDPSYLPKAQHHFTSALNDRTLSPVDRLALFERYKVFLPKDDRKWTALKHVLKDYLSLQMPKKGLNVLQEFRGNGFSLLPVPPLLDVYVQLLMAAGQYETAQGVIQRTGQKTESFQLAEAEIYAFQGHLNKAYDVLKTTETFPVFQYKINLMTTNRHWSFLADTFKQNFLEGDLPKWFESVTPEKQEHLLIYGLGALILGGQDEDRQTYYKKFLDRISQKNLKTYHFLGETNRSLSNSSAVSSELQKIAEIYEDHFKQRQER